MAKQSAKDGILLIGGYNFSTYAMSYEVTDSINPVDVTGLSDGVHNFIPTKRTSTVSANMLWDAAANQVNSVLRLFQNSSITILPEGYTLGAPSLTLPYMQGNYSPAGSADTAISLGTIAFNSFGNNIGVELGYALQHGTITNTLTGAGVQDITAAAATAIGSATLHVWQTTTTDTYVIKVQHSTTLGSGYVDYCTFAANGTSRVAERVQVASGTINQYRRVLATRTGAAGDTLGFTVHFARL